MKKERKVKVQFCGPYTEVVDENTQAVRIRKDETVGGLIQKLTKKYGREFEAKALKEGRLRESASVLVNGKHARSLEGLETKLADGDEVVFLMSVDGG